MGGSGDRYFDLGSSLKKSVFDIFIKPVKTVIVTYSSLFSNEENVKI